MASETTRTAPEERLVNPEVAKAGDESERGQDGVQALVALLGLAAVALDPGGHQVEHLRLQVDGTPLGVP